MIQDVKELSLFSKSVAAKILGIGIEKLHQLIDEGKIGFIMMGDRMMIPYKSISQYIEENTVRNQPTPKEDQEIDLDKLRGKSIAEYEPIDTRLLLKNILENDNGEYLQ